MSGVGATMWSVSGCTHVRVSGRCTHTATRLLYWLIAIFSWQFQQRCRFYSPLNPFFPHLPILIVNSDMYSTLPPKCIGWYWLLSRITVCDVTQDPG